MTNNSELEEKIRKIQMEVEDYLLENHIGANHPTQEIWISIEFLWRTGECGYWDKARHLIEQLIAIPQDTIEELWRLDPIWMQSLVSRLGAVRTNIPTEKTE